MVFFVKVGSHDFASTGTRNCSRILRGGGFSIVPVPDYASNDKGVGSQVAEQDD